MKICDLIQDKKMGKALSKTQIEFWINGIMNGSIADYQTSALLMAIVLKGMTDEEATYLTLAMAHSGDMLDLSPYGDKSVDKHSSGGVGDSTTFVVLPIVVACGMIGAKMSGRGLGHTGGTLDKLEAIHGVSVDISPEQFYRQINDIGIVVAGQSKDICPADKKLYALRDVTATVDSIPLIASSIMSKKLSAGAHNIVLDVKCGRGAFMPTFDHAKALATLMVNIGKKAGKNIRAVITNMDCPLSDYVGNSLEVFGAIEVLQNKYKGNLYQVSVDLATNLLQTAGVENARQKVLDSLENGSAYDKFVQMVKYQGGEDEYLADPTKLLACKFTYDIVAPTSGYVQDIDAMQVARVVCDMGGGRKMVGDSIDYQVGVKLAKNVGDKVSKGEVLATMYCTKDLHVALAGELQQSFKITKEKVDKPHLILDIVR